MMFGTQDRRQRSNNKAFQTNDSEGYQTIENMEKFYHTVKPTDDETFNKIVDFS